MPEVKQDQDRQSIKKTPPRTTPSSILEEAQPAPPEAEVQQIAQRAGSDDGARAERLRDPQMQTAQRQALGAQLGKVGGNRYLQRMVQSEPNPDLPRDVQQQMEGVYGQDFSNVRIHTDSQEAVGLRARAFTQGEDIHIAPGLYQPHTADGQLLLGHELSHVVQQRSGIVHATQEEQGYLVSEEASLEARADREGLKAARGEWVGADGAVTEQMAPVGSVQKKSQAIQLWRDVPGQIRVESTAPDSAAAWGVFMSAARQAAVAGAGSAEGELRAAYFGAMSLEMRGRFTPIAVDLHTTSGYNFHWTGTIRFVFADDETQLQGGGTGTTTMGGGGTSTVTSGSSTSTTAGSSGGGKVTSSPGSGGGTGGEVSVGGSGSTTTGTARSHSAAETSTSSSAVTQNLARYTSGIGVEVSLSASYDMGSSWTDWINPAAYGTWGAAEASEAGSGTQTGLCGSVVYYKGAGITAPAP